MSRFCLCNCPAGFSAAPERHAPDCPGRSGAGKPRALLDAERCTSCDGSGEYIDALGDWRGYCVCPAGVALKNKPAAQPQGEQVACMPVERCYDVRVRMIRAFNEAKKAGGDLDDALDAAYKSALRHSPNPLNAEQPALVALVPKSECPNCLGDAMFGCDVCIPDFTPGNGNKARRRAESLDLTVPTAPTAYDGFDNGTD